MTNTATATTAQKIGRWLRPFVFANSDEPLTRLVLKHISVNDKQEILHTIPIEESPDEDDLPGIANEIDNAAYADADGMGGMQKYVVYAYSKGEKPIGRLPFRVYCQETGEDGEPIESEPATPKGMIAQAQRFSEAAIRMSLGASGSIITQLQRTVARQAETIEKLTEARIELFDSLERVRSEANERDILRKDAELKAKIRKDAFDKFSLLVPLVINKLTGRKLLPEELSPVEMSLKQLAESITPEQMEKLRSSLSPEQLIVLGEFMLATQGEKITEREPKMLASGNNGQSQALAETKGPRVHSVSGELV